MSWALNETFKTAKKGASNYPSKRTAQGVFLYLSIATGERISEKDAAFGSKSIITDSS
jgi:hypothetical protein